MHAPGLTVRQALKKFAAIQLLDVHLPTTDGRELIFTRYTEPERDQQLLLAKSGATMGTSVLLNAIWLERRMRSWIGSSAWRGLREITRKSYYENPRKSSS